MTAIETKRQVESAPISNLSTISGTAIISKPEHVTVQLDQNAYVEIAPEGANYSAIFKGAMQSIDVRLQMKRTYWLQRPTLRFNLGISSAGDVVVLPVAYWINRIEIWSNNGSGINLQQITGDELYIQNLLMSDEQLSTFGGQCGLDKTGGYRLGKANEQLLSTNRDYYLPLMTSVFNHAKLNLDTLPEDLRVRIYFNPTCIRSGSGVPTLNSMGMIFETDIPRNLSKKEQDLYRSVASAQVQTYNFTDCLNLSFASSYTLAAGVKQRIRLDQLDGKKISHLFFAVRASGKQEAADGCIDNVYLGNNAQFDVTLGTASILGFGQPIRTGIVLKTLTDDFSSAFVGKWMETGRNPWYMLSFSDAPGKTMAFGSINNAYEARSNDIWIEMTPDSTAGVACVQTITSDALTAGTYHITYKGHMSAPLARNATVAQMKAAFEAIPAAREEGLNVTFSDTLANASITATFSPARPVEAIGIISQGLLATATAVYPTVAITTAGRTGLIGTATYDIRVLAYTFAEIVIRPNGIQKNTL